MLSILNGIQGLVNLLFFRGYCRDIGGFVDIRSSVEKTVSRRLPLGQDGIYCRN